MLYEAIFFDFDGVLADSEPIHFACWQEILAPFGVPLDWDTYARHGIGASDRMLVRLLCSRVDPPVDHELVYAEYPRKRDLFRSRMLELQPFSAELRRLLPQLHEYPKAVVTSSGQPEVEPVLIRAGLREYFTAAVFGGDVTKHKPEPDPYLLAIERLGVRSGLAIEDSDAGEQSARAAGLEVLRVRTPAEVPELLREKLANF